MWNYIKDAIFNVAAAADIAQKVEDEIVIKRFGNYSAKDKPSEGYGIQDVTVTEGKAGVAGKYTIGFTALDGDKDTVYHFEINVKMEGKFLGEYANANWGPFGKKIIFEVMGDATADDIKAALQLAVKDTDVLPDEGRVLTVNSATTSQIVVTLADPYMSIPTNGVFVGKLEDGCTTACELLDFDEDTVTVTATTAPVLPFATGEWLEENLRFPTYYNRRYAAVGAKNAPVPGQVYDQVTFNYVMPRTNLGGLSAVGQKIESATTHVLYVPAGQGAALKTILES